MRVLGFQGSVLGAPGRTLGAKAGQIPRPTLHLLPSPMAETGLGFTKR